MQIKKLSHWGAGAVLLLLLIFFSRPYLSSWFIIDDMSLIHAAATKSSIGMLFDRETYLTFHQLFYTPLFPLLFKPDWFLFKLNPAGYHALNLTAVFLTSLMAYRVLRLYLPSLNAWAGTCLFSFSYPNITNIAWITRKHYIWGTFLILLSFYLFKKSEKTKNRLFFAGSLSAFFMALLLKEAFVTLPAAIFLLSSGGLKPRILKTMPYCLVLGVYVLLRYYFLGGLGGYIYIQTMAFDAFTFLLNGLEGLEYALSVIWGSSRLFLAAVFVLLILTIRKSWIFVLLFFIWAGPFMILRFEKGDFTQFYYPSKFTLAVFVVSSLVAFSLKMQNTGKLRNFLVIGIAGALLVLQVSSFYRARDYIDGTSGHFREVSGNIEKNIVRGNVFVVDVHPHFYNHFFELKRLLDQEKWKKRLVTTDRFGIPVLEPYLRSSRYVFFNGTWHENGLHLPPSSVGRDSSPPPRLEIVRSPPFVEGRITDTSPGKYIVTELTYFSDSNILSQSIGVPRFMDMKIGLIRERNEVYVYRKSGDSFSSPAFIGLTD